MVSPCLPRPFVPQVMMRHGEHNAGIVGRVCEDILEEDDELLVDALDRSCKAGQAVGGTWRPGMEGREFKWDGDGSDFESQLWGSHHDAWSDVCKSRCEKEHKRMRAKADAKAAAKEQAQKKKKTKAVKKKAKKVKKKKVEKVKNEL